jgi:hypothetical protein
MLLELVLVADREDKHEEVLGATREASTLHGDALVGH